MTLVELAADPGFLLPQHLSPTPHHETSVALSQRMRETLERLAKAEEQAFAGEFLAPAIPGGVVQIRIAGVVCRLKIEPDDFAGWGVFRTKSPTTAELVRPARLGERRQYLELLPLLRLVVCLREENRWLGLPAHRADTRFRIDGLVHVRLIEEAQLFEVIQARFDGSQCWYDGPEPRHDPRAAAYLREALAGMVEPDQLSRPGLTAEERAAYAINYAPRLQAELEACRDRVEERLRAALAHAGAEFKNYQERGEVYRVTYEVEGCRHTSAVARNDLSVQVAGICLSGEDHHFDLQSLVGVLREARGVHGFVRVGLDNRGMPEEDYWRAHPPAL